MNLKNLDVEESYKGPYLEVDISKEFMENLIDLYKKQGKLHAKYAYKVSYYVACIFNALCIDSN